MLAVCVMGKEFTGCQYIRFSVISSVPLYCEEKLKYCVAQDDVLLLIDRRIFVYIYS